MNFYFYHYRQRISLVLFCLMTSICFSQSDTSKWKFQIAFGLNQPNVEGFIEGYQAKPLNFPTINLGIQHMFTSQLGAKLDLGYNRFTNADNSMEFKTNYTRINPQIVYDATNALSFLPSRVALIGHAGPGITFMKPLGNYSENKQTFANVLGGLEIHYGINETVTLYTDLSYAYGLGGSNEYNPINKGFGAFTGNLLTVTLGVSVSLSGCYFCD